MLNKLKTNLSKLKNFRPSKNSLTLWLTFLILNSLIVVLEYYTNTWYFIRAFIRVNVIQIIIVYIVSYVFFYWTYKQLIKKNPARILSLAFVFLLTIHLFTTIGMVYLVGSLTKRAAFTISTAAYIFLTLYFTSMIVARYDFALVDSVKRFILNIFDHFNKNLGMFLSILFIVGYVSFVTKNFMYVIAVIPVLINVYLIKALLSNLRR